MIELHFGDCQQIVPQLSAQGIKVDMILTDPPYGVLNRSNKHSQWDIAIPFDTMWSFVRLITNPNTPIVLFAQGMYTANLMQSNPKQWRYNLVWKKGDRISGFLNANRMPLRNHEDICIFYQKMPIYNPQMEKGLPNHKRGHGGGANAKNRCYGSYDPSRTSDIYTDDKYPKSVLNFDKEHGQWHHPTQKPVALLEYLIRSYTNEGDTVLDFTMGSGSTAIACQNTNRNFIGIESNPEYFRIAQQRVEDNNKKRFT